MHRDFKHAWLHCVLRIVVEAEVRIALNGGGCAVRGVCPGQVRRQEANKWWRPHDVHGGASHAQRQDVEERCNLGLKWACGIVGKRTCDKRIVGTHHGVALRRRHAVVHQRCNIAITLVHTQLAQGTPGRAELRTIHAVVWQVCMYTTTHQ